MAAMNTPELLRMFLQVPELSSLGGPQERAAFIALRLDGRTVRQAGQAIGVSKSHVQNLANLFEVKLAKKIREIGKTREARWSSEYRRLYEALIEEVPRDYDGGHKIGNFKPYSLSREDWAEVFGGGSPKFDDE
jgi:hypothetical protein